MLKTVLSITGKPGLYKLVSRGKNMLIVESLGDKKRFPAYGNEKIISLGDISMYTDEDDVPLSEVLFAYLAEVLPEFDRDRVHASDVKKLISWYNLLVASGMTDFEEDIDAEKTVEASEDSSASEK